MRVLCDGTLIADSTQSVRVLETASPPTFYIPHSDIDTEYLLRAGENSHCEWKGAATYWTLRVRDREIADAAWSYEQPYPEFETIAGHLSFYPSKLECYVGDHRVEPQPGGFYGGWVTPEIVGPFKGEPGTGGW